MSWDIGLLDTGDISFNANGDIGGITGTDLLEQRMKLRLRLHRGSWLYDTDETLGSLLYRLIGMSSSDAQAVAAAYVREALRPIDEISVDNAEVSVDSHMLTIIVDYHTVISSGSIDEVTRTQDERQLEIQLPLTGGG